jgi:hypothetical protein
MINKISGRSSDRDDYYLVVVFRDTAHRTEFLTGLGMEDNRYQDGRRLQALLQGLEKPDLTPDPECEQGEDGEMKRVEIQATDAAVDPDPARDH